MEFPVNRFDTLSEAVADLRIRGFTLDFNLEENSLSASNSHVPLRLNPNDFEVAEYHRFEGDSNPDDESIVYGIISRNGQKGILVNAYGPYAESVSALLVSRLAVPESRLKNPEMPDGQPGKD